MRRFTSHRDAACSGAERKARLAAIAGIASVCVSLPARADPLPEAPRDGPPGIAWGVRANLGLGTAGWSEPVVSYPPGNTRETWSATALRVGLDGEYWLSEYLALGAKVGATAMFTDICYMGCTSTNAHAGVFSVAPTVTFRLPDRPYVPWVSLAVGYSWGHASVSGCDPAYDVSCTSNEQDDRDVSGLYEALMVAWLFHPGSVAIGPLVTLEGTNTLSEVPGWAVSAGFALGFGMRTTR
jgi:hypothetical protein